MPGRQQSIHAGNAHKCKSATWQPPARPSPAPPQHLLCYLARLARHAESCTPLGLAGVLGPVLLEPEQYRGSLPVDAATLTAAAIWVVQTLIECAAAPARGRAVAAGSWERCPCLLP